MDIFEYLTAQQQSPLQSFASSIPYYNYTKNLGKYYTGANSILDAMQDPTSQKYQQIYGQQRQQGQQNLAETIAELSRQNRKLAMMGRVPLFNEERGGEQQFRALTQGYQDVQNRAAGQTQDILGRAYQGAFQQGQQRQQNDLSRAGVNSGIFGALSKVFGL